MNSNLSGHRLQDLLTPWRMIVLSGLVGGLSGLGAVVFYHMLDIAQVLLMGTLGGYNLATGSFVADFRLGWRTLVRFLLPAAGGLIGGWLVFRYAPEAEGHGTDAAIDAYHNHDGMIRGRIPLVKALASAITIGSGGSAGQEGPIAQIGAGLASQLAALLRLSPQDRRILMSAGLAGGVGAIFQAPLAGALFAAEVMYRDLDLEYEVLVPSIISSIGAYSVFSLFFGWQPYFAAAPFVFMNPLQLLPYLLLALVVAGGSILYVRTFYGVRRLFHWLPLPLFLKPALGGLMVGAIALFLPEAMGTGSFILRQALNGGVTSDFLLPLSGVWFLLLLVPGKILTTSFSIGSGGSGGVFGPAIVIGGALGGVVGHLVAHWFPGLGAEPGAFVLVGMAGFFAAAANTPISTIIIVSEMTGNYNLLVPSMWVCFLAYLMMRRVCLYQAQVPNRFEAPVHLGRMIKGALAGVTVQSLCEHRNIGRKRQVLRPEEDLSAIVYRFMHGSQTSMAVCEEDGRLLGTISRSHLQSVLIDAQAATKPVVAADLAQPALVLRPADTLEQALIQLREHHLSEAVVQDPEDRDRIIGVVGYHDIMAAYHDHLQPD